MLQGAPGWRGIRVNMMLRSAAMPPDTSNGPTEKPRTRRSGPSRLALVAQLVAKARGAHRGGKPLGLVLRRALFEAAFLEAALRTFGPAGMTFGQGRFFPLFLLPDYRGPHFDEALRRLALPGRGPFVAHLSVTGACASRCSYCYASAGGANPPDLGDEQLLEVARVLVRRGVPLVNLSGGEPLARYARVEKLVEILAPSCEVRLATSGVGLTAARAAALRERGLQVVAVSLDSADPDTVNRVRGYRGAFDAAVEALRLASRAGCVTFATSVVGPSGFRTPDEVERLLRLVRAIHPDIAVNFVPMFATGRGADAGVCDPAPWRPVAESIARVIREHGFCASVLRSPVEALMGCVGAGGKQLNIGIRGQVTPCISSAGLGNIVDEPFDAIYERFLGAARRLKRGFFCARGGAGAPSNGRSLQLLDQFHRTSPDTFYQRVLDRHERRIAWLFGERLSG